jgi:hypothetical protein
LAIFLDKSKKRLAHILTLDCIVHDGWAFGCIDLGDNPIWIGVWFLSVFSGGNSKRKLIYVRAGVRVRNLEVEECSVQMGDIRPVANRNSLDGFGLCAEPSLARQILPESFPEKRCSPALQQVADPFCLSRWLADAICSAHLQSSRLALSMSWMEAMVTRTRLLPFDLEGAQLVAGC